MVAGRVCRRWVARAERRGQVLCCWVWRVVGVKRGGWPGWVSGMEGAVGWVVWVVASEVVWRARRSDAWRRRRERRSRRWGLGLGLGFVLGEAEMAAVVAARRADTLACSARRCWRGSAASWAAAEMRAAAKLAASGRGAVGTE